MKHLNAVRELIALTFGIPPDQVTLDTKQNDLAAWDSIGHLNLMLALEDAFNITLELEEMARLTSVAALLEHLEKVCPSN